jgi:hypothetical protein
MGKCWVRSTHETPIWVNFGPPMRPSQKRRESYRIIKNYIDNLIEFDLGIYFGLSFDFFEGERISRNHIKLLIRFENLYARLHEWHRIESNQIE